MNLLIPAVTISAYFLILLVMSRLTTRVGNNDAFFRAGHRSPWPLVAFGMIGASVSGVSFVSVPGYVGMTQMTYLQMCLGFFFGYLFVAYVLLPVYYRNNLTTIYSFLEMRLGPASHKTGALFFILSKATGAAVRFYLTCLVLQQFLFGPLGIPYIGTVLTVLLLVWLYTRRAGIRTLVYTDCFQTFCFLAALVAVIVIVAKALYSSPGEMLRSLEADPMSRIFVFDDWGSRQNFWKQFVSGIFIVIVMTGLDQDMMQKNLTCRNLRSAQKDMCLYGVSFVPVNLLLLVLGVMLYHVAASPEFASFWSAHVGGSIPTELLKGDSLFPTLVQSGIFGTAVTVLFILGITAAAFSSVDSALTALTTSICIDLLGIENKNTDAQEMPLASSDSSGTTHSPHYPHYPHNPHSLHTPHKLISPETTRKIVHLGVVIFFVFFVVLFRAINSTSAIDAIYTLASYTYGPLLGLFLFAILTHRRLKDRFAPLVAALSPLICWGLSVIAPKYWGYTFGYELLMLNGLLTFLGLWLLSEKRQQ